MSDNHIDYLEQLFQGVDILIDKKLQGVSFDSTIVCTIIDDSNSKNGKYQVTDGTIRFDAYSDSDKYKLKDQVRVAIANSDYSDKKYIIGKYVGDNDTQPLTYTSPLNSIVNVTGNLVPSNRQSVGIIANDSNQTYINICNIPLADGRFADLQNNDIYSSIVLKADFKTLLHGQYIKSGSYGLRLILLVKPSVNSSSYITKTAELSSTEMFGNPYAFSISTEQAKIFEIGTEGLITNIALQLYQNNDFYDINNNRIPTSLTENIIVSNIELGFGSNLINIGDNTLKIYTENDPAYRYQGHTPSPYDRKLGYPNQINADTNLKQLGLLWYNKNDLNEYIGFSDGIYDPNYDEIEYLDLAREDTRLTAHIGREGVPTDKESLELAANIEEAKPLIESALKVVTQDLITMLRALNSQFNGIDDITNHIDDSIDTLKGIAVDNDDSIKALLSKLVDQYAKVLAYGKKVQDKDTDINTWDTAWETNYGEQIKNAFAAIRTNITTLLDTNIASQVVEGQAYSGYAGVYDTYKIRLKKVIASMDTYLDADSKHRFPEAVFDSDLNKLKKYNQNLTDKKTNWKIYIKKDLADYDNKFCIYWFRYEKDYINDEIHQFMPNGWRRLDSSWSEYGYSVPINIGVPGKGEQIDGKTYNEKRLSPGEGMFNIMMRYNEPEERFVAIVFHNHNMYKSNELVFSNTDRIPEIANIETGDLLLIKHIDKSRDGYQCYNLTNYLMDSADASHLRQIRVSYDGLLHGDEILSGGGIYWYVPTTSTMLAIDIDELTSKGFVNDSDVNPKPLYHKPGYICFYKQISGSQDTDGNWNFKDNNGIDTRDFWYKIKPYYEATANLNSIKCEFRPAENNNIITGEQFFTFGVMGSNGTKYTLAITPATSQVATTPSKNLQLDVSLRDFNNEIIDIIKGQTNDGSASDFVSEWLYCYHGSRPTEIMSGNKVIGLNALANSCGIVKATVMFQLSSDAKEEGTLVTKKRTVQLETVRAIPWSVGDYYISGPTSIIYNSLGTIDNKSMFDNPYRLYALKEITLNGVTYKPNQEIPVSWERTIHTNGEMDDSTYKFYEQYMPVINDAGGLTPAPIYLDGLNCYLIVHAYVGDINNKNYLYHQPVVITQNRFGSSVLNEWDGSLTIDKDNGTILSTMIGAGRKTIENTFEGVLMGDVAIGSKSDIGFEQSKEIGIANHTGLGLYGFHGGVQSFGFNADGTAFLGKSGKGRIIFNGNSGVIASSNWFANGGSLYRDPPGDTKSWIKSYGTDGMCIDLENGHIDAYNFKLTSGGIYLNSNPDGNDFYFYIGDRSKFNDEKSPCISYTGANDLVLRVKNLSLTGIGDFKEYVDETIDSTKNYIDTLEYLNQENVFAKLTQDGKAKGIFLQNNDLYINATYMVSGILRSSNWEGVITDSTGALITDIGSLTSQDTYTISAKNGTYIDLNKGKIWARAFELRSGAGADVLVLNSNPRENEDYLYVGNTLNGYIKFSQANELSIAANKFNLNVDNGTTKLILNSNPALNNDFYFYIGGDNEIDGTSYINFTSEGQIQMRSNAFILQATGDFDASQEENSHFVYLSNIPTKMNESDSKAKILLKLGSKFGVDYDGKLYAGYARISGGSIGGWSINSSGGIKAGNAQLTKDGDIIGAAIYIPNKESPKFKVDSKGVLAAIGAEMSTLTVKDKLIVYASDGKTLLSASDTTVRLGTLNTNFELIVYGAIGSSELYMPAQNTYVGATKDKPLKEYIEEIALGKSLNTKTIYVNQDGVLYYGQQPPMSIGSIQVYGP